MEEQTKTGKLHGGVLFTLFISLTVLLFYSPAFVRTFPLFQIQKVEINIKNPALEKLIKSTLRRDFSNNWLYLWLNEEEIQRTLAAKSYAAVKNLNIDIDPFSRSVEIKVKLRQPVAKILGTPYYIALDNVLVKKSPYLGNINTKFYLEDTSLVPKAGEKYSKIRFDRLIKELLKLNLSLVKVNKENLVLEGKDLKVVSNFDTEIPTLLEKVLLIEKLYPSRAMEVDFRNHKMVSIKIYNRGE